MTASRANDPHRFDDLFQNFGPIAVRRFFGGEGIFSGDVMLGMVFDDRIFLKTDAVTRKAFVAENCKPFSFVKPKSGETVITGWYAIPDRLYDDPEEFAQWARAAFGLASRSQTAEKKRRATAKGKKTRPSAKHKHLGLTH